jgi:hypothetical protein
VIPKNKFYWDSTVMILRVESRGIINSAGTTTHFRILVDGVEVSQGHVAHRQNDQEQVLTFFGAKTVVANDHTVKIQCKVSGGQTTFDGGKQLMLHGMSLFKSNNFF